ncbi:hypothetical protein NESM_000182300 [Novymonas esmeraldas]|uniref:Uncharacterized protein n=1 Tax=Novymonas esmeraldas TaxID=1808958 RepID=A0AAW0F858_9TRYP
MLLFNLSAVVALLCGVAVQELQLPLLAPPASGATAAQAASGPARRTGKSSSTRQRAVCAAWYCCARRRLVAQLVCQREDVLLLNSSHGGGGSHMRHDGVPRGAAAAPTSAALPLLPTTVRAVAEALPCLGCAPSEALPTTGRLLWGTPRWPGGTLHLNNTGHRGGGVAVPSLLRTPSTDDVGRWTRGTAQPFAAAAAAAASVDDFTIEMPRAGVDGGRGVPPPSTEDCIVFRDVVNNGGECLASDASAAAPAVSATSRSVLLPDLVCLRRRQPQPLHASALGPTFVSGTTDGDATPPAAEVVLIAVEALPELHAVRRRGLQLYAAVLLSQLQARQQQQQEEPQQREAPWNGGDDDDGCSCCSSSSSDRDGGPEASAAPLLTSLPPPFAWRCELWTVSPDSEAEVDADVGREVVCAGLYSPYASNKRSSCDGRASARGGSADPVTSLAALGDELAMFAEWWRRCTDMVQTRAAASLCTLDPVPAAPCGDVQSTTCELMHWWCATRAGAGGGVVCPSDAPPLPALPSSATPLFGAIVVPQVLRRTAACERVAVDEAPTAVPALTLCFISPKGAPVHRYDQDALHVLCRAVHSLGAAVWVSDAAQKAALLAWMGGRAHHHVVHAAADAASSTPDAIVSTSPPDNCLDAVAEVAQHCYCIEDYVTERWRQQQQQRAECRAAAGAGNGVVLGLTAASAAGAVLPQPSPEWCGAASRLSYDDVLGRRRLDLATRPWRSQTATSAALDTGVAAAAVSSVPLSFLAYLLTRLATAGAEQVEPLTESILHVGRRLGDH